VNPLSVNALAAPWWPEMLDTPLKGRVCMCMSTRVMPAAAQGSARPYDAFNLGDHVGDAPASVAANRAMLAQQWGAEPVWLNQVHGVRVARLSRDTEGRACADGTSNGGVSADGAFTTEPGLVCAVMVADCLPVLLAAPDGRGVAALHAGWRGLCGAGSGGVGGVVDVGVTALCEATGCEPSALLAWLGPCIGPAAFEVSSAVLEGFGVAPDQPHAAFRPQGLRDGALRWLADLPALARERLNRQGVRQVAGGHWCTVSEPSRFFSFRRDGVTGRQAAGIWLLPR
jgi:YfiH family protein